jgi:CubicO group peptidase (beta-lactamase class C family)
MLSLVPPLALLAGIFSVLIGSCPNDPSDLLFGQYDGGAPGATVAIVKEGTIIYERSFGIANLATNEKTSSQTNYRLASVTKPFTSLAIGILADKKQLSFDDPVGKYLPELREIAPKVTIRHLLTHTSGLPEYEKLLPKGSTDQILDRDVLRLVASTRTEVQPIKRHRYNNTGYALLALVIEKVSKQSYGDFIKKHIFTPAGMSASTVYKKDQPITNRALGYSVADGAVSISDQERTTAVVGDGGVYSSAKDLAHFLDALDHDAIIDHKRLVEMTTPRMPTDTPGLSYGMGWRVADEQGERVVFHTGTTSGFKNVMLWVPSRKLGVIVLTNRRQGDPLWLGWLMLSRFWDAQKTP